MAWNNDLKTARDNLAAKLKEISANPKPTYSLDGESISWVEYYRFLREEIANLNRLAEGPFEVRSRGVT